MKNTKYQKELKITKQAALEAGAFLKKEFFRWKRGSGKYKNPHEMVTWCDKKAEKIIFKHLNKHFSEYSSISEESGKDKKKSDYVWVVDPLDGTHNFMTHNPVFSTSIALLYKNKVVLGITFLPILNELYWAIKNQGAYKNNKKITVSNTKEVKISFVNYCHGSSVEDHNMSFKLYLYFQKKAIHCRHLGSTTIEIAQVAAGHTDVLIVPGGKIWDLAAGTILVQEAKGMVTDFKGKTWRKDSASLVVCNKKMHPEVISYLKKFA